ncbi:ATP-binding protein [Ruminococcus sp. Marseille-P328]|uniref:ATP-binding protein n=1 Tax=Ruminococcus sp. Marseille-P328 TaxID=1816688 RepID=UPI003567DBCF
MENVILNFSVSASSSRDSKRGSCSLSINHTKYVRLPDLLIDLEMARTEDSYKKGMAKYANPVVLILDEWLLLKPTESEQRDIFELLHRRRKKFSSIFCSQYEFKEWYD